LGQAGASYSRLEGSAEHSLRRYLEVMREVTRIE
jgi:hypothetical protein